MLNTIILNRRLKVTRSNVSSKDFLQAAMLKLRLLMFFLALLESAAVASQTHFLTPARLQQPTKPRAEIEQNNIQAAANDALREARRLLSQQTSEALRQADEKYEDALRLWRAAGDKQKEVDTLLAIGADYDALGNRHRALWYYNQALALIRSQSDRTLEADTLMRIGVCYFETGEKQQAIESLVASLGIARELDDKRIQASALYGLGMVHASLGEIQQALELLTEALSFARTAGDLGLRPSILYRLAMIYQALGDQQRALSFSNDALNAARDASDREAEAIALTCLGMVHNSLGDNEAARTFLNRSLPISRELHDRAGEAYTLYNLGVVEDSVGNIQKGLEMFIQSLALNELIGDLTWQARNLIRIGMAHRALGNADEAAAAFKNALAISRSALDWRGEASSLYWIARCERESGDLGGARAKIESAIEIIESVRARIAGQELRTSYFASVQQYYEFSIDLLMQMNAREPSAGFDALALRTSERARARSLIELLAESRADIRQGVDPELLGGERALAQQLANAAARRRRLSLSKQAGGEAVAVDREIKALTTRLEDVESQIRAVSPRYASLTQPRPLGLKEIQQQVLDSDTLLLEYWLGEARSFLWVVGRDSAASFELPARSEIESLVRRAYELLTARNRRIAGESSRKYDARIRQADDDWQIEASSLADILLGPVASQLGGKRLLIIPHGALQLIPFGALPEPDQDTNKNSGRDTWRLASRLRRPPRPQVGSPPLVANHEILTLPSASTLAVIRQEMINRKPAPKTIAIMADPVFSSDDERLKVGRRNDQTWDQPAMKNGAAASAPPLQTSPSGKSAQRQMIPPGSRDLGARQSVFNPKRPSSDLQRAIEDVTNGEFHEGLPRLFGTRIEAEQIAKLVPPAERMKALDFAASLETATSPEMSEYRIVHFASHALIDTVHPELSGIVLSLVDERGGPRNGFLRAHEVFNLKLPAELVVLNACRTGLGKEIKGEGLVGLTRAFMYAGARRVIVSLWSIRDQEAAEFMVRFYKRLLGTNKLSPAAALRAAQLEMREDKRWQSPYFWGAFILQGEWR
jgi:CHAT domain-containing protein/tetratricopeptide (TPR) repeat protein